MKYKGKILRMRKRKRKINQTNLEKKGKNKYFFK